MSDLLYIYQLPDVAVQLGGILVLNKKKKKHNYNNENTEAENIIAREEPKEEKPQPPWMTFSLI